MNQAQTIDSGKGLLQDNYGPSPLSQALKKRREKMTETHGLDTEKDKAPEDKDVDDN